MKKLLKEFKDFISRGNVLDLAVGMIIGAAFTAIITAIVTGILKPLINWIPLSETGLQTVLREAQLDAAGNVTVEALVLDWGAVISAVITFLLTALVLFIIVKAINTAQKKAEAAKEKAKRAYEDKLIAEGKLPPREEPKADEPAAPKPTQEELLTEIRDILASKK